MAGDPANGWYVGTLTLLDPYQCTKPCKYWVIWGPDPYQNPYRARTGGVPWGAPRDMKPQQVTRGGDG